MEPNIFALSKAGFSKEQIEEITGCDDKEIRMLRKYRYLLLDEIHGKQKIPIGRVTSDLAVFENLDSREEITFSLVQ
ncbi:MAG: hypothetical protein HFG81_12680 [Dorea sp.]|nr:hypothetical protein [Dorea sp.]